MRKDMSRVLVERPRAGGCGTARLRQNRRDTKQACKRLQFGQDTEVRSYRGMKKVHTSKPLSWDDLKQLNENLKPLRRFLFSKVGESWDNVYSEIMQGLNLRNAVQYHVWQHLIQLGEVHTKTYMEGSTIMAAGARGPEALTDEGYREQLYVHPKDGTLRCTNARRHNRDRLGLDARLDETRYIDSKKPPSRTLNCAG